LGPDLCSYSSVCCLRRCCAPRNPLHRSPPRKRLHRSLPRKPLRPRTPTPPKDTPSPQPPQETASPEPTKESPPPAPVFGMDTTGTLDVGYRWNVGLRGRE